MTNDDVAREADYGRHEILDRSEMIMGLVGDYLMEHQDIRDDEKALARRAHDALFRLYQAVGGRHLRGDENPLAQSTGVKRAMSIMMDYAEAYDGISGDDLEDGGPDPAEYIARIVDALESGQPGDVDAALTVSGDTEHLDDAARYLNGPPTPFQKG